MPLKTECKGNTIFSNSKNTSHIEFRAKSGPVKVLTGSVWSRSSPGSCKWRLLYQSLRKTEFPGASGLNLFRCNLIIMCKLRNIDNFQLLRQPCKNMPAGASRLNLRLCDALIYRLLHKFDNSRLLRLKRWFSTTNILKFPLRATFLR